MSQWKQYVQFGVIVGIDRVLEAVFRLTHRPGGLAHDYLQVTREVLTRSIALGTDFIRRSQYRNGSFRGFLLEPGASTTWITAHTAFVLEDVPQLKLVCARAAKYLHTIGYRDGGWGYNRIVGNDADSSSQALMVLHRHGLEIPAFLIDQVVSMQTESGGFPTYRPSNPNSIPTIGWEAAHPDVTVIVVEMLRRLDVYHTERTRAIDWLFNQTNGGVFPSYWWNTPAYGLWAQARAGLGTSEAILVARHLLPQIGNVPELPMLLYAAIGNKQPERLNMCALIITAVIALLSQQQEDGSWECSACLRVTDPSEFHAKVDANGHVYQDKRRLFSTVHAIAVLSLMEQLLDAFS